MKQFIPLYILLLISTCIVVQAKECHQTFNIYWFGSSQDDVGNWIKIYGNDRSWGPFQQISSPVFSYPSPINAVGIEAMGAKNRFADGNISPEFLAHHYNFTIAASEDLTYMPRDVGNIVCFGIAGSTAIGNEYNTYNLNQPYNVIAGIGSYQYQVERFLELQELTEKTINPDDAFIYSSLFSTDILAIFNDWNYYGPTQTYLDMQLLGNVTIENLGKLADAGAKHFVIMILDPESAYILPNFIKYCPCLDEITNFIDYLLTIIDETLYNRLESFQVEYGVNVDIIYYSEVINATLNTYPTMYGFRTPFPNDLDPRIEYCTVGNATFPFPTFMDTYLDNGGNIRLYNVPWFDDRQITSHAHITTLMPVIVKYLNLMEC